MPHVVDEPRRGAWHRIVDRVYDTSSSGIWMGSRVRGAHNENAKNTPGVIFGVRERGCRFENTSATIFVRFVDIWHICQAKHGGRVQGKSDLAICPFGLRAP